MKVKLNKAQVIVLFSDLVNYPLKDSFEIEAEPVQSEREHEWGGSLLKDSLKEPKEEEIEEIFYVTASDEKFNILSTKINQLCRAVNRLSRKPH